MLGKATPEGEAVDANGTAIQDMGIDGLNVILHGYSGNANNDDASNLVNKIIKWFKDGNGTTGYTKGRFGLRMDNAPQWNVVPTSTYGFHLMRDSTWHYVGDHVDLVEFTLRLGLGDDIDNAI